MKNIGSTMYWQGKEHWEGSNTAGGTVNLCNHSRKLALITKIEYVHTNDPAFHFQLPSEFLPSYQERIGTSK